MGGARVRMEFRDRWAILGESPSLERAANDVRTATAQLAEALSAAVASV